MITPPQVHWRYIGHNPLNQLAFSAVYVMLAGSVVTGFALYGLYDPSQWFFNRFQWVSTGWAATRYG